MKEGRPAAMPLCLCICHQVSFGRMPCASHAANERGLPICTTDVDAMKSQREKAKDGFCRSRDLSQMCLHQLNWSPKSKEETSPLFIRCLHVWIILPKVLRPKHDFLFNKPQGQTFHNLCLSYSMRLETKRGLFLTVLQTATP